MTTSEATENYRQSSRTQTESRSGPWCNEEVDPLIESDPRQLGPYKIVARLGAGGMGVVFLGSKGSQRVAVKVMRASFLDSQDRSARFAREIQTLKKLKSPFVARYLDSDVGSEIAWHAVEFVNGPTLKERIENDGPMGYNEWWDFYEQLRDALTELHESGVIHRDLKPTNIILSDSGLKLIDFGISQELDATSITATGVVAGSPAWLSPEHLEGGRLGPGSDLFSAGSVLIYAALGRSPWGAENTMSVPMAYQKILTQELDTRDLPDPILQVVTSLFAQNPHERAFTGFRSYESFEDEHPSRSDSTTKLSSAPGLTTETHELSDQIRRRTRPAAEITKHKRLVALVGAAATTIGLLGILIFNFGAGYSTPGASQLNSQSSQSAGVEPPAASIQEVNVADNESLQMCIDEWSYVPERVIRDAQRNLDSAYSGSKFTGSADFLFSGDKGRSEAERLKKIYYDLLLKLWATDTEGWHPEAIYSLEVTTGRIQTEISKLNFFQNVASAPGTVFADFESAKNEIRRVEALPPSYNIEQSVKSGDGFC